MCTRITMKKFRQGFYYYYFKLTKEIYDVCFKMKYLF